MANTDRLQKIGNYPHHDRPPSAMALVRASVAEERHNCRNAKGVRAAAGIGQSQKLDQVIVDRRQSRLHEEDLLAAHGIKKLHGNVAVRIPVDDTVSDPSGQLARDHSCQGWVGRARENREIIAHACLCPDAWVTGSPVSSGYR